MKFRDDLMRFAGRFEIRQLVWSGYAFAVFLVWSVLGIGFLIEHERAREQLAQQTSLSTQGFSEYVARTFDVIDQYLMAERVRFIEKGGLSSQAFVVERFSNLGPLVLQLSVIDERGVLTHSSLGAVTSPVDLNDREHFKTFRNDPADRLFISKLVVGRVSNQPSIQLARPLLDAFGKWRGVIVASVDPQLLQQYFQVYDAFSHAGVMFIVGHDGAVRLRATQAGVTWGKDTTLFAHWRDIRANAKGSYISVGAVDGVQRYFSYHQVGHYPFSVVLGYDIKSYLSPMRWISLHGAAFGLLVTVGLALMALPYTYFGAKQQKLIAELRESQLRAQEANQMKSNFLASVSHELRTPLNSILGFSELIRDLAPDPTIHKYGDLINKSGHHLLSLVNTVLDLAKIEAGRMDVNIESVDLKQVLTTLIDVHSVSAEKKGLVLSLIIPPNFNVLLSTDRTKLLQVLNNVLHNAVKFTSSGAIRLAVEVKADDCVGISVLDSGCGIAQDKLRYVFDRFSNLNEQNDSGLDHGSGLGLSLSKNLLFLLGGGIAISSVLGAGTRVDITLPLGPRIQRKNC